MDREFDVVIVGAGHGGAQTAIALRQNGFDGSIALIGDEPELPYERPPLSKDYLAGEKEFERLLIRPPAFWESRSVDMLLSRSVVAVEPAARRLICVDGSAIGYDRLVWAAGGTLRRLTCDGNALNGVHGIRSRADVDRLRIELEAQPRAVIVGGGYIGLEAAAVLAKRGLHVTLLEAQGRVLNRVAGEELSLFYEAEHRAHGVDIRTNVTVSCLEGTEWVSGVRLADGSVLPAGMVIVGIGIVPAVGPLLAAGAEGSNGVLVDEFCATTLPDVFAIGDCALHANSFAAGAAIRLESVQNASDMAVTAARAIVGAPERYCATPWFWSNQYDLKLQTVGLSTGYTQTVLRGDPANRSFSVIYLRDGQVVALDCVNAVRDYVQGRKLVERRAVVAPDRLADAAVPLKDLEPA